MGIYYVIRQMGGCDCLQLALIITVGGAWGFSVDRAMGTSVQLNLLAV